MNDKEARQLIKAELSFYEEKTYADLVSLIDKELIYEKQGPSGTQYQIEILIMWDSTPTGAIRILGSIDDGGWRAFFPLTDSVIVTQSKTID
jgi:hypothetical protein